MKYGKMWTEAIVDKYLIGDISWAEAQRMMPVSTSLYDLITAKRLDMVKAQFEASIDSIDASWRTPVFLTSSQLDDLTKRDDLVAAIVQSRMPPLTKADIKRAIEAIDAWTAKNGDPMFRHADPASPRLPDIDVDGSCRGGAKVGHARGPGHSSYCPWSSK